MEKSKIRETFERIDSVSWFLIVGITIAIFYFSWNTRLVPNVTYPNITGNYTCYKEGTLEYKGCYMIGVPQPITAIELAGDNATAFVTYTAKQVLYPENSFVPRGNMSMGAAFVLWLIFIGLVWHLIMKKTDRGELLTEPEIKQAITENFNMKVNQRVSEFVGGSQIKPLMCHLKYYQVGEGEFMPKKWVQDSLVIYKDGKAEKYFRWYLEPYKINDKPYITNISKCDFAMERTDVCPVCGTDSDTKIILPKSVIEVLRMVKGKEGFGGNE